MKYKVGDKVRVRSWEDMKKEFSLDCYGNINMVTTSFYKSMKEWCGKTLTIKGVYTSGYRVKETGWWWIDEMFEPINHTIVIYTKNNQVIALDKTTGKTGIAYCSPEDRFDFYIGADLAYMRLRDRLKPAKPKAPEYYNGEIVCTESFASNLTKGKIYKVKNGQFTDDNGNIHGTPHPYPSLAVLNLEHYSKFIEVVR